MEQGRGLQPDSDRSADAVADSGCVAELDRRYRSPLIRFFQRRGCAAALAEDLTQDVFLRVVAYRQSNEIQNLQSFVFQTAANRLRDDARSARRWNTSSLDDANGDGEREPLLVELITPERILQGRQDVEVVTQAFAELDVRTQRIFLMNRVERLRHRDIADHLNLSVSLVEKTLRTAQHVLEIKYSRQRRSRDARAAEAFALTFSGLAEGQPV